MKIKKEMLGNLLKELKIRTQWDLWQSPEKVFICTDLTRVAKQMTSLT